MNKLTIAIPVLVVAFVIIIPQGVSGEGDYEIPSWIKNLAMFWANDQITDEEFGTSITYLIDRQVIKVPIIESLNQENLLQNG